MAFRFSIPTNCIRGAQTAYFTDEGTVIPKRLHLLKHYQHPEETITPFLRGFPIQKQSRKSKANMKHALK